MSLEYKINAPLSLDQFILELLNDNNMVPEDYPFLIEHRFFLSQLRGKNENDSLFNFIRNEKNIRGSQLFNDIQGLKYDLLQIHDFGW